MPTGTMAPATTAALLQDLGKQVKGELVQRDAEVDAIVLALIARQHVMFVGEPGIAKTLVTDRLVSRIGGCSYFYIDLGPTTAPEDIFGDQSVAALREDRPRTFVTEGMAPEAHVVQFDEWTRAGAACLQSCLAFWNERTFKQAGKRIRTALSTGIFSCNHLIDEKDMQVLAAAYDRILLRRVSEPVVDVEGLRELAAVDLVENPDPVLTWADVEAAQAAARQVVVPDEVVDAHVEIFGKLATKGLRPSNRRWRESFSLVKAAALLAGRDTATLEDLEPLVDVYWNEPEQRREVERIVWAVSSPEFQAINELLDGVATVQRDIDAAIEMTGADRQSATSAARRKIKQHALEILEGQKDGSDRIQPKLDDVWRRLQGEHDRIMVQILEFPPLPLRQALEI